MRPSPRERMKRVVDRLLTRQTPGAMSLSRLAGGNPTGGGARSGPDRKGLARPVHQNRRPRPETSDRATRSSTRSGDRQARQISSADSRRSRLRHQGSGRDERSVRTDQRSLRAPIDAHHRKPALWRMGKNLSDQAMTLAAIDRLVHHATILEMNVDSYRRKEAVDKARGVGRPPTRATIKGSS